MPALHGKVELRRLQSRDLEVGANALAVEGVQPLLEALPGAGEDGNLLRQDGAESSRRLLVQLLAKVLPFVTDAQDEKWEQGGRERAFQDQRAQVDLHYPNDRRVDGEQ